MNNQKDTAKIIDWTDRKEAMATYRKYEELGMLGPNYMYYNGKLLPAPPVSATGPETVEYDPNGTSENDKN
jgi:hypothetical protein